MRMTIWLVGGWWLVWLVLDSKALARAIGIVAQVLLIVMLIQYLLVPRRLS
jgi:hypothetical protein